MKAKKGWITIILVIIILLIILGGWFLWAHHSESVQSNEPKKHVTTEKTVNKNHLTVKKVTADKQLLLAVIVKYAMVQDNQPQLHHFSLKDHLQFVETKEDDQTTRYDVENNKQVAYITVMTTKDNKGRVVFWNSDNKQITSITLSSMIKLLNQTVSEQALDKLVKKISVQADEQASSSSSASQQSQTKSNAQDVTIEDLQAGYLQSDTAMKAILYYAEHNPNALSLWKGFIDTTAPLTVHPNAMASGFSVTMPESGGAGTVSESSESTQNGSHALTISVSVPGPSMPQYVVTPQEIVDFVNAAGGKDVISGIQYQIENNDPSTIVSDDDSSDDEDYSDDDESDQDYGSSNDEDSDYDEDFD